MKYYSLNKGSEDVDFRAATILGQAPDKGLYFPESIPAHPFTSVESLQGLSPQEIGFRVMKPYVDPMIPDAELKRIIKETLSFDIPLVRINENIYSLELYHGPTLAFKDVGARFMSRCLGYFSKENKKKIIVLVATSGDTGGAVADGFYGVDGVEVVILYPSGKVSPVQELQLTTYEGNIHALEVQGDFDACQKIVKQAFADTDLTEQLFLTSANSINVARWLPQQMYYFLALQQWKEKELPVVCVPSGNFGNICAGMMAWRSGLPIKHFVAACNANDVVTQYLLSGEYKSATAVPTISNAMDVGDPSNFVRILNIFDQSYPMLKEQISSYSISDAETEDTIAKVYNYHNYLLDPHGAVAYAALEQYLNAHPGSKGMILETAHPVKFPGSVEKIIGRTLEYPPQVEKIRNKEKKSTLIRPVYQDVKDFLLSAYLH
ncbi:MAG TPA: threonine synthase [Chitinophagaceae bacterium]|nr:threonine synthase [Chitinophagaceae bacterium]